MSVLPVRSVILVSICLSVLGGASYTNVIRQLCVETQLSSINYTHYIDPLTPVSFVRFAYGGCGSPLSSDRVCVYVCVCVCVYMWMYVYVCVCVFFFFFFFLSWVTNSPRRTVHENISLPRRFTKRVYPKNRGPPYTPRATHKGSTGDNASPPDGRSGIAHLPGLK